jgi:uncharacterized OB-fold protein
MPVGLIVRDDRSAEFFDATAQGRLILKRCDNCARISEPRTEMCPQCGSTQLSWVDSPGAATVVAYGVVNGRSKDGAPPTRTPIGIVELDEGPWLHVQIVTEDPDSVAVGSRVTVAFERAEGGEAIPVFTPV